MAKLEKRWALVFAMISLVWALAGCGDDACSDDGDCPQGTRCAESSGLFFGANTCITEQFEASENANTNGNANGDLEPDAGGLNRDGGGAYNAFNGDATSTGDGPPTVVITDHPAALSNESDVSFEFECDQSDCTTICEFDGDGGQVCDSPMHYDGLADGSYRFEVWAENEDAQSGSRDEWSFEIDTTPPQITFEQTPDETTLSRAATFEVSCDKEPCELECQLVDVDGDFGQCSVSYDGLETGDHLFRARATDAAGNTRDSEFEWTVEAIRWKQVDTGNHHTCAIMANDDSLWCWGPHEDGRTGVGLSDGFTAQPMQIEGAWASVTAGSEYSCAITEDGALYCWGANGHGQLGLGNQSSVATPQQVGSHSDWHNVSLQAHHTCGVRAGGRGYCWGNGEHGKIGDGEYNTHHSPVEIRGYFNDFEDWHEIGAGLHHTCGRRSNSGSLWCWGLNFDRYPAYKTADHHQGLSVGWSHNCAIGPEPTQRLYCWGENNYHQVGVSDGSFHTHPVGLSPDWTQVGAGVFHSCGVRSDASIYCWGDNEFGQLGVGDTEQRSSPTPVDDGGHQWVSVAGGHAHSCAIDTDDKLYCWGNAGSGKLANGSISGTYATPQPVKLDFL